MKIFIVEDDSFQLALLKKHLSSIKQAKVIGFSNIDDCLFELSVTEEPFIIVTDIEMPDRTGVSLITELQRYDYTRGLLILSGVEPDITDTLAIMASFVGIPSIRTLTKPLNIMSVKKNLLEMMISIHSNAHHQYMKAKRDFSKEELQLFLMDGNYHPYFQPQICSSTGQTIGVEMLGRLHLNGDVFTPDFFIDKLIKYNSITDYTYELLEKGIKLIKAYDYDYLKLSINVEYCSLQQEHFFKNIESILTRLDFNPHNLMIELTEHESDITINLLANVTELRVLGVQIAADDFGMGKSGLNELLNLPFKELKIDRSFVSEFSNNPKSFNILKSIVAMSKSLGLKTVAEGVETIEQSEQLKSLGVDFFQGYLFGKPVPIYDLKHSLTGISELNYSQGLVTKIS